MLADDGIIPKDHRQGWKHSCPPKSRCVRDGIGKENHVRARPALLAMFSSGERLLS
jgi:hypothetical protein